MFSKLFGKKEKDTSHKPDAPEIMGLYLGGSFEIDALKLKLLQPKLKIDGAASQHLIQAVGKVVLDTGGTMFRFYTDDDAFLQIVTDGGETENHITDVKLWYFWETLTVGSESQWQSLLNNGISQPAYEIDGDLYERVWEAVGDVSPPVAMTETTFEQDGDVTTTDQFIMLYERAIDEDEIEAVLVSGEEKIVGNNHDRCLVTSTGFNLTPADITING
ncbi:YjfK family protein [Glaciecola sp. MH2013]|uniref:YjfK family protein n=1 Tax=Glaciecola sp. MH2013 TaxID=2785524 RepID=UPI00189D9BE3|nr:YjfK family protein [Glaciecola sp. MH2013]MBF7074814.1 YjfK family protein [Glaciecola sp. MH2013]